MNEIIKNYVEQFNKEDNELYKNTIDNEHACQWMEEEIPLLECPDKDIERTYYFRWWTLRKHIKDTADGYMISEFLPDVPWAGRHNVINAPVGHHIAEARWLKNSKKYLNDYINLMLNDDEDVKSHQYSSWLIHAMLEYYKVTEMPDNMDEILEKVCHYHEVWEEKHGLSNGMFWSTAMPDAMEFSLSGNDGLRETKGIRPTLNSYMCADRYAIAELAKIAGREDICEKYTQKADELRKLINDNLLVDGFYRAFHPKNDDMDTVFEQDGTKIAKELIGYIPWMFNIPDKSIYKAFDMLTDDKIFYAPWGLTTADQSEPRFLYEANHECLWNGYVWPFATSQTLTGLKNVIRNYNGGDKYKKMYAELLIQYAKSHVITDEDGNVRPWIDEMRHPYKDEWTTRVWLEEHGYPEEKGPFERGKDYNHSTFCDLVISGLLGVREDKIDFTIEPIIPDEWEYFRMSKLYFRGECYSVDYNKNREEKWIVKKC